MIEHPFSSSHDDTRQVVALAIPTRNQEEYIVDAIASAFAQTVLPVDVVVCDDAGTDATKEVVDRFRDSLPVDQRRLLRYERNRERLGIGANFDRAVRLADGDFVVKLDSDDVLEPEFVKTLKQWLEQHPKAGWAHCNVLNVRPDCRKIGLAHNRKRSGFYPAEENLAAYLQHNDTCHCVMIRKEAYLAVGGYRPEMKTAEDWLLWVEMILAGWGYCYEERPLAKMRKYSQRNEMMTQRRSEFLASITFMEDRLRRLVDGKQITDSLKAVDVVGLFLRTASRLCLTAGMDERDRSVRGALFEASHKLQPGMPRSLQRHLMAPMPVAVTRIGARIAGLPRLIARKLLTTARTLVK